MACKGCEERREWIRMLTEEARKRAKKLIARLNSSNEQDDRAEQPIDRTSSS